MEVGVVVRRLLGRKVVILLEIYLGGRWSGFGDRLDIDDKRGVEVVFRFWFG